MSESNAIPPEGVTPDVEKKHLVPQVDLASKSLCQNYCQ